MARSPRLRVSDVALHIVQRGVDRQACFREDSDFLVYLSNLRDVAAATRCALHAYCLMTNHVHLLITPGEPQSCSLLMRNLGQRYVRYFNQRHGRTGTLWEGRFRSCLVDSAQYVLACYRYIELNPVRAGMVASPFDYGWSSYASNVGLASNGLITPHAEYLALGEETNARIAAYRRLFEFDDDPAFLAAIRDATKGGYALVSGDLKTRLAADGRRLARGKPGPRPASSNAVDDGQLDLDIGELVP
ncbi:MAG TPA: transposase [Burkholderiales bacterium]